MSPHRYTVFDMQSPHKAIVTDPVTDDGSDRGVPQTKTGTRSVSDLSLEELGL